VSTWLQDWITYERRVKLSVCPSQQSKVIPHDPFFAGRVMCYSAYGGNPVLYLGVPDDLDTISCDNMILVHCFHFRSFALFVCKLVRFGVLGAFIGPQLDRVGASFAEGCFAPRRSAATGWVIASSSRACGKVCWEDHG
jgi:hypothetical protein